MAKNRRNIILRIQDWIESVAGQTFLNYAYSWGAAVVILGALFKLTHIPGANAMLFIGMGTEVVVFFISGFDRPAALKREEELERTADSEDDWDGEEDDGTTAGLSSRPSRNVAEHPKSEHMRLMSDALMSRLPYS